MTATTDTYRLLRAFVDELVRCGMRAACTSPGSRSAPLVLSLARERRLRCYSHIDERCAGFFALGLAKSSGLPVAVACTSGTAVAELLPAAIEAREARVPLLLLSADRPPELRENGAGQAIDQLKLFGDASKWFFDVGIHDAGDQQLRWMRTLACRAYWTALEGRAGVVHLNFALREPLVLEQALGEDASGRGDGRPYVLRPRSGQHASGFDESLLGLVRRATRGVVIAGRQERDPALPHGLAAFAEAVRWPLLADPLSGARTGAAAIAHYDALLREPAFADAFRPDLVLRVGDLPVSKPLRGWLAGLAEVQQLSIDPERSWQDPASVLSDSLALDPGETLAGLTGALTEQGGEHTGSVEEDWLARWRSADELAAEAIVPALGDQRLSEPSVAVELGVLLPAEATLFVASSMPVRDIETFWPVRPDPPRVLCNRGANGIDGTVSSAFGAAADADGPVVLLIGDVALAHDIGGLLAARRLRLKLTIVLIDNDGGGIFEFLPLARAPMALEDDPRASAAAPQHTRGTEEPPEAGGAADTAGADIYTQHVATPSGLDFAHAAALYGLGHERAEDLPAFRAALERAIGAAGSSIVEVRGTRAENVALHAQLWRAVSGALNPRAAGAEPAA
jgi:2-succinyl-5-enolpyruvyl-6-hydroxy-3-cyclohexene-1-carboxylate synthase